MPTLNGPEVRHRAAELVPAGYTTTADGERRNAQRHFVWLAERSGIPVGTIQNATRDNNPQGIALGKVYDIAAVIRREGEDLRDTVTAITLQDSSLKAAS